jgi:hypothetical protein
MRNSGRFNVVHGVLLSFALSLVQPPAALAQNRHTLPLFVSASHQTLQGFARIINLSDRDGEVTIHAIDDAGDRSGPVTLSLKAKVTRHFNSDDLKDGNTEKGLSGGVGSGQGNWRLEFDTDLDIDPLIYTRPRGEGFITSTHDVVAQGESMRWRVPFFNPGSNMAQQSRLRVVNTSGIDTAVRIEGLDDNGAAGIDVVRFDLAADAARTLSAQDLEQGSSDSTFTGRLGDGAGKWQLFVSADEPIQVMNLLISDSGYLTNLSTSTIERGVSSSGLAPVDQTAFDARFVGKRMQFVTDLEYADFVSAGRLIDTDDGGTSLFPGSYTYRNAGPDSGALYFHFDAGVSCPAQVMFDSASTGTLTHSCGDEPQKTETWQLVEIPAVGFAPADQAEFDVRFVGKRWLLPGEEYVDFVSPGRFVLKDRDPVPDPGSYTYSRTGRNTGTFDYQQDEDRGTGVRCMLQITFVTAISGNFTLSCTDGEGGEGTWRTVDIPAAGFAPEDQVAFDARFVGKRWSIALPLNSGESLDLVWYFVSSGHFEEYEDGERTERGTYTYQNTGPNTGNIPFHNIHSDGPGPLHTWNVTFDSATAGTLRIVSDGTLLTGSWRVAGT